MLLLYIACSSSEPISVFPSEILWGEINFAEPMPDDGYMPFELSIKNETEQDVTVLIVDFDWNHLCIQGYSENPEIELPTLSAGDSFILRPSVCKYLPENGERDTNISGNINIGERNSFMLTVPWSFTPVLQFQDSG